MTTSATGCSRRSASVSTCVVDVGEGMRAIEAALSEYPGLVVAGAALRGVGVPECLQQGLAAASTAVSSLPAPRRRLAYLQTAHE